MSVHQTRTLCTMVSGGVILLLTGINGAGQAPRVNPYLPKPTGLSEADIAAVKLDLAKLGSRSRPVSRRNTPPARCPTASPTSRRSGRASTIRSNRTCARTSLERSELQMGLERASQLMDGQTPWMAQNRMRDFISKIDGSAQPYKS